MVKAVLFDLDGTLWNRSDAVRRLVEAQHECFSELAEIPKVRYVERVLALDARGLGDKREAYRQVAEEFGLSAALASALCDHFWSTYQLFYEPFPEVIPTLRQLARLGLKLGIITNGNTARQEEKLEGLGLVPLMDTILISDREGVRKPDPAIFDRALQRLGVPAEAAWFVGDHPDADIRGAREAGLTAVLRRTWAADSEHATYTISSLDELISLLRLDSNTVPHQALLTSGMPLRVFIQNEAGSCWKHYHDEKTLVWKRKIQVSPPYPFPYGFVIGTTAEDGGNVDCFVITKEPLSTGAVVDCVPIGLLEQFENGKPDHNVLVVPQGTSSTHVDQGVHEVLTNYLLQVSGEHLRKKKITVGRFLDASHAQSFIDERLDTRG